MSETEHRYVALGYDSGAWGGDLTALLLHDESEGWSIVASHISSTEAWAKHDIAKHAERLGITAYEWVGLVDAAVLMATYPPAPKPVTTSVTVNEPDEVDRRT